MNFEKRVIAAVKGEAMLKEACRSSVSVVFDLLPNISTLKQNAALCRSGQKLLFIHLDLAEGIGKDKAGLAFIKDSGVPGIISTRASLIKMAGELGLKTVQRVFAIDSQALSSAETIIKAKPDMVEVMPGIMPRIITEFKQALSVPIIAGGLVKTKEDVIAAVKAGATAVSTSMMELWSLSEEGK